ncbi:MAG: hypothetical protein OXB95_13815 [Rhodobacteraceae bacterium]|nr:hypothetical protein [Paracoccaceae bacterium]
MTGGGFLLDMTALWVVLAVAGLVVSIALVLIGHMIGVRQRSGEKSNRIEELERRLEDLAARVAEHEAKPVPCPADIERLLSENQELLDDMEKAKERLRNIDRKVEERKTKPDAPDVPKDATIQFPSDELRVAVTKMPDTAGGRSVEEQLSAFKTMPECLRGYEEQREDCDEQQLLNNFEVALRNSGLHYPTRIIRAFHTALKVNDISPLTVLSGLSGTGKSQLPRAYARFFGIHFLHVPVEPGWDSPQDILGYYDFVSERYRPTDRARALGHFDRKFAHEIGIENDRDWNNRMLIILLDEMNLARTEYYFSEFLSRLEMRGPRPDNVVVEEFVRPQEAQIAIDLPYSDDQEPKHLYVPHNVLWIGTLNEDETTQALSDKVIDRANTLRFAPPNPDTLLKHAQAPETDIEAAFEFLPYERWLEWSSVRELQQAGEVDATIRELAKLMKSAGRGFAYRTTQSMRAYIERHVLPNEDNDWRPPMIDQINMRLLPKLAGSELEDCQEALDELQELCRDRLNDGEFAGALEDSITDAENTQIFSWPGYTYPDSE